MPTESETVEFANNTASFYELLNIVPEAEAKDVRRAYRKTALQYHPDKNPDNPSAVEKFHLLTAALDILCDASLRAAYDNALNARAAKKRRTEAYDSNRRTMKENLEARENLAKRTKIDEDVKERELENLRMEGARRRMEMNDRKKRDAAAAAAANYPGEREDDQMNLDNDGIEASTVDGKSTDQKYSSRFTELDRTLRVKYRTKSDIDRSALISLFSRFGEIEECVVKPPRRGTDKKYSTALVIFKNIANAYAAVRSNQWKPEHENIQWSSIKDITWAGGKEPDLGSRVPPPSGVPSKEPPRKADEEEESEGAYFPTPLSKSREYKPPAMSVPSFRSFHKSNAAAAASTAGEPSLAEDMDYEAITMMRMRARAAEKKRLEEEILRKEEEGVEE